MSERSDATLRLTFALPDTVDLSRAPWATNASERIVFGHLYETLITIDCTGEVSPGLAEAWRMEEGGRSWIFELRKDARFWDGSPVTAGDVVASWQDALTLRTAVDSVRAVTDRRVRTWLKTPYGEAPRVFSAPVFAVTRAAGDSRWLMGSGRYAIEDVREYAPHSVPDIAITVRPSDDREGPPVVFQRVPADRTRDHLQRGLDFTVTADPAVIEYASSQSRLVTAALPWEKTYALLSTSRVRMLREGMTVRPMPPDLLDRLARDAVRGDARRHEPPSWWGEPASCEELRPAGPGPGTHRPADVKGGASLGSRRILYDAGDPVARALAERIAALAAADTARSQEARAAASAVPGLSDDSASTIARGAEPAEFGRSLRRGDEFAYVVSLPRVAADPCREAGELAARAPWLSGAGVSLADALVPLVDTRSHLIARKNAADILIDGYGGVLVVPGPFERDPSR